jgi:hypothetical protein
MALNSEKLKNIRNVTKPGTAYMLVGVACPSKPKFKGFHPPPGWPREYDLRERRYGTYDGMFPAIWDGLEAYAFSEGVWHKHRRSDMLWNAGLMAREEFDRAFPNLPALPPEAFKPLE